MPTSSALIDEGIAADVRALEAPWRDAGRRSAGRGDADRARERLDAGLPAKGGRQGVHTEHLGYLLAEMQFLQRAYPGASW